jgi:ethanolamine utilization protein EutP (predicted NTPase)
LKKLGHMNDIICDAGTIGVITKADMKDIMKGSYE